MNILSFTVILLINAWMIRGDFPDPIGRNYLNNKVLLEPDVYQVFWNTTDTDVIFEVHVKNARDDGYGAFGLSPNGGMANSDIVVFWANSEPFHFSDRYIDDNSQVFEDKHQDWFQDKFEREGEYLKVKFSRKLRICNSDYEGEDREITEGPIKLIFAHGDVNNGEISYHGIGNRGTMTVQIIGKLNNRVNTAEITDTNDFTIYSELDRDVQTDYRCGLFKIPDRWEEEKMHIIEIETLYTKENKAHFHHTILYECDAGYVPETIPPHGSCVDSYNGEFPAIAQSTARYRKIRENCNRIIAGWAIGGDYEQSYPENMGYPIGGQDSPKYYLFEIHFDNHNMLPGIQDESGIRLHVTNKLQDIEVGLFTIGGNADWNSITIPPNSRNMEIEYQCSIDCTGELTGDEGVTLISSLPHSHLAGVKMKTTVIRDNKEILFISNVQNYDSEYQNTNYLLESFKLKRGDRFLVSCTYDTTDRTQFTIGKDGTYDEMCLDFITYYPRKQDTVYCIGTFEDKMEKFLKKLEKDGKIEIPKYNESQSFGDRMERINRISQTVSQETIDEFQDFYRNTNTMSYCGPIEDTNVEMEPFKGQRKDTDICASPDDDDDDDDDMEDGGIWYYLNSIWEWIMNLFN